MSAVCLYNRISKPARADLSRQMQMLAKKNDAQSPLIDSVLCAAEIGRL